MPNLSSREFCHGAARTCASSQGPGRAGEGRRPDPNYDVANDTATVMGVTQEIKPTASTSAPTIERRKALAARELKFQQLVSAANDCRSVVLVLGKQNDCASPSI